MKRIKFVWLGALAVLLGVAACEIEDVTPPVTPQPPNFDNATVVTPSDATTPIATASVVDGGDERYQVDLPATFTNDLLYVEVSPANAAADSVRLELYNSSRVLVRQSDSPDFFTGQAITINPIGCRGPCILLDAETLETPGGGVFYLIVETESSTAVEFDLFIYEEEYGDTEEPGNNDCDFGTSAIVVTPIENEFEGAVETLEDRDCYQSDGAVRSARVETFGNTTVDLYVNAYDRDTGVQVADRVFVARGGNSVPFSFDAGASFRSVEVEIFGVDGNGGPRAAAPAAQSGYRISFDFPE